MGVSMEKKKITIEVPEQVAQAYERASASDRERVQRVLSYALKSREEAAAEIKQLLDRIGTKAEERGLTEEKLNELLDGES